MRVLAIDSSTARLSVALVEGENVIADLHAGEVDGGQAHGEQLAGLVQRAVADGRPELIAVGLGPGPYTGLRVGIVTAEVLATAWGVPVRGVSSMAALAHGFRRRGGGACCTVADVKRREIALQAFDAEGKELGAPYLQSVAEWNPPELPLVGPAFMTQRLISPKVADHASVSAVDIAMLARTVIDAPLQPLYLRQPDAAEPTAPKSVTNG